MASLYMTGASGFIGRNFLSHYADRFETIVLPLRKPPSFHIPKHASIQIVTGDADEIADGLIQTPCTHVLNAAAYGISPSARNAEDMMAVNTQIPVQLAKAAQKVDARKFVQLGTMSEYKLLETQRKTVEDDALLLEQGTYGGSKAHASRELEGLASNGATEIICLRLFGVYGPGEGAHRLIVSLYNKFIAGEIAPMSPGTQVRDFIYITDVLSAMELALTKPLGSNYSVFNIGSGKGMSVADFSKAFCRAADFPEDRLNFGALPMRDTDVPYIVADIEAANEQLGWTPQKSAEAAFAEYMTFLRQSHQS